MKIPTLTDIVDLPGSKIKLIRDQWRIDLQNSINADGIEKFYPVIGKKPPKIKLDIWGQVVYESDRG